MTVTKPRGHLEKSGLIRSIIVPDTDHACYAKMNLSVCAFLSKILYQTGMKDPL